jgi:CubicO group peptidase (beta-lactamase class C family)/predicted dienelactone hydrolase
MKHSTVYFLALLLLPAFFASAGTDTNFRCASIHNAVNPFIENGVFAGNLSLSQNGKMVCRVSADVSANGYSIQAIKRDAVFPVASLSKPIVASLILKLQEVGALSTKDTLAKHLPHFDAPWANRVTLHHLLSNRSGLANHFALPEWPQGKYQQPIPHDTLLNDIAKMTLQHEPGSHYVYSNLGYLLLGEVVKSVTKASLGESLENVVFAPLGMTHSGLWSDGKDNIVNEYLWGPRGGWKVNTSLNTQVFNGGAGIVSTSDDLHRFVDTLHQGNFLSTQSRAEMFDDETPYGWNIDDKRLATGETLRVHHYNGQLQGYSSFIYYVVDSNISITLLNNTSMGFEHKQLLVENVLDAFLEQGAVLEQDSDNETKSPFLSPSLLLNKALLEQRWDETFDRLSTVSLVQPEQALLVNDLAMQLNWSAHADKAIDLFQWLVKSFPAHEGLKKRLEEACIRTPKAKRCNKSESANVGMQVLPFKDETRHAWRKHLARPMTTHLFYPSGKGNVEQVTLGSSQAPVFNAGHVVKNGTPLSGKYPLVMMSHGTGGSALQMLWLAEALVKQGYVVAAVNHHGNTAIEDIKYPEGFLLWWERAHDLVSVQAKLANSQNWSKLIDHERVAVIGFSLGGYTALSALGGITNKEQFDAYCQKATNDFSCQPQPEFLTVLDAFEKIKNNEQVLASQQRQKNRFLLANVKAGVAIAPAILHAFEPDSMTAIETPTLFLTGTQDTIAPSEPNAIYANALLQQSEVKSIEHAGHYSFLSTCTDFGKATLEDLCHDSEKATRRDIHDRAIAQILPFLNQYL